MNLYRIHYAWNSGGASASDINYYESENRFKADLLDHHLDIMYEQNTRNWLKRIMASKWRKHRGNEDNTRRTTKLLRVEGVKNDEWVPVDYAFIEPDVVLDRRGRIGNEDD